MFLLSCRAHPLRTGLPLLAEYAVSPGLVLCLAAEPSSVHFRECPAGFYVELSPLAPIPATPATRAVSINWDAGARELVIRAEPHADTAVYHHVDPQGGFVCASRVALLREAGVPIEENEALLPEYFRYRYVLPPFTLFRDIHQLAKAELRVDVSRERCRLQTPRPYPVFPEQETAEADPAALADRTLELLEASFQQLRPKAASVVVPLSGGMDSSVLFRLAQRAFGPSDAWSAGYPFEADAQNREREYAASAAEAFAARHRYHSGTTASYLEALIRSIAAAEEPVHHMQSAMIEQLFRDAVPTERDLVVLGTGASGVFGSPLQQLLHRNARHPRLWRTLARSPLPPLVAYASRRTGRGRRLARRLALPRWLEHLLPDPRSALASVDAYCDPAWIAARFGAVPADLVRTRSELLDGYAERALLDRIAVIDLFDKTQFLWAKILHSVGRRSWFPFMQSDVQRHVLGAPWALRLRSDKFVLAEVARRLGVPEFILGRAKSGFGVRRDDWAVRGGPLDPLIEVAAKRVDASELRSLQSREPGRAQAFWCLLNLGLWRRLCIDGEASEVLLAELRVRS